MMHIQSSKLLSKKSCISKGLSGSLKCKKNKQITYFTVIVTHLTNNFLWLYYLSNNSTIVHYFENKPDM